MKIEMEKRYRTREGKSVRILCNKVRRSDGYSVLALVAHGPEGENEVPYLYTSDGYSNLYHIESPYQLVEIFPAEEIAERVIITSGCCCTSEDFVSLARAYLKLLEKENS